MIDRVKAAELLAKFRLRKERGMALLDFVRDIVQGTVYYSVLKLTFDKYMGISLPYWLLVPLMAVYYVLQYLIGYLDEKVGFWKFENQYASETLNPHVAKLNQILEEIKKLNR